MYRPMVYLDAKKHLNFCGWILSCREEEHNKPDAEGGKGAGVQFPSKGC